MHQRAVRVCPSCEYEITFESTTECPRCGTALTPAIDPELETSREASAEEARLRKLADDIIVTSTHTVQNRIIVEYIDVITAEVVLETGFFWEFRAATGLLGSRARDFRQKLRTAKDTAMGELRRQAVELGADAIAGVDMDYAVVAENLLMVTTNGTAVRFERVVPPEIGHSSEGQ